MARDGGTSDEDCASHLPVLLPHRAAQVCCAGVKLWVPCGRKEMPQKFQQDANASLPAAPLAGVSNLATLCAFSGLLSP